MRCVLVSDISPRAGGVYGLRAASFAQALADRGHQVLLLAPAPDSAQSTMTSTAIAERIMRHDWSGPLQLELTPHDRALIRLHQSTHLPQPLRRLATAWLIAAEGGTQGDWVAAVRAAHPAIVKAFRPDIVWANFGNLSNLVVGQELARAAKAPWVIDFKDNFSLYVPNGLRRMVERRFRDAVAFTSNAELHADIAGRWFDQPREIIYSSVARQMIAAPARRPDSDHFVVTLTGSIYSDDSLASFLRTFTQWIAAGGPSRRAVTRLQYAGAAADQFSAAIDRIDPGCETIVQRNVPHERLAEICHGAAANCYIWSNFTFHHKALELMACRRPVISFPGEYRETVALAERVRGDLRSCTDEAQLAATFDAIWDAWRAGAIPATDPDLSPVSWDAGAAQLERLFATALTKR